MTTPAVSTKTTQRIDRLLRSLVGVADVRMLWRAHALRAVHILRADRTQPHQLIRNIVSGLQAGFAIQVLPTQVHIHDDVLVFEALDIATSVLTEPDPEEPHPEPTNGTHANGGNTARAASKSSAAKPPANGGTARARSGAVSRPEPRKAERAPAAAQSRRDPGDDGTVVVRPSSASADTVAAAAALLRSREQAAAGAGLRLERIDVDRRGGTLRCRTVLSLGDRVYSAIAEVPDGPSAEAELAARVAVDALRAGGLTSALLDGVGFITIAKTNYCVATVRESGSSTPRASAAPMIDSMAAAATAAVLTALGSFTDARAQKRARADH
jgi:hypothetical protein